MKWTFRISRSRPSSPCRRSLQDQILWKPNSKKKFSAVRTTVTILKLDSNTVFVYLCLVGDKIKIFIAISPLSLFYISLCYYYFDLGLLLLQLEHTFIFKDGVRPSLISEKILVTNKLSLPEMNRISGWILQFYSLDFNS